MDNIGKGFVTITPSDTVNIAKDGNLNPPNAVRFGTGGTAVIVGLDGSQATITNISNGEVLPIAVTRINATGTTAANIVGFYL